MILKTETSGGDAAEEWPNLVNWEEVPFVNLRQKEEKKYFVH